MWNLKLQSSTVSVKAKIQERQVCKNEKELNIQLKWGSFKEAWFFKTVCIIGRAVQ